MSGSSNVVGKAVKVSISNKVFHVVQMNGTFPMEMQPSCTAMLILEPTPFIQLIPIGQVAEFCEQYVQVLESRGESDAQIARFRHHASEMAQVVHWCAPDTLLVPEELCKPIGNVITVKCTELHGVRLMESFVKKAEEL